MALREQIPFCRNKLTVLVLLLWLIHKTLATGCSGLGCFSGGEQEGSDSSSDGLPHGRRDDLLCGQLRIMLRKLIWMNEWVATTKRCDWVCERAGEHLALYLPRSALWRESAGPLKCNYGSACLHWFASTIEWQNGSDFASTSRAQPMKKPQPIEKPVSPEREEELAQSLHEWIEYFYREVGFHPADWIPEASRKQIWEKHSESRGWRMYFKLFKKTFDLMKSDYGVETEEEAFDRLQPSAMCQCNYALHLEQVIKHRVPECSNDVIMGKLKPALEGFSILNSADPEFPFNADAELQECNTALSAWECTCYELGYNKLVCVPPPPT